MVHGYNGGLIMVHPFSNGYNGSVMIHCGQLVVGKWNSIVSGILMVHSS